MPVMHHPPNATVIHYPAHSLPHWAPAPHKGRPTTPTSSTVTTHTKPPMVSSTGYPPPRMEIPAADNLRDAISFRSKKAIPRNVIYMPNYQMQSGQQLQMQPQAPVSGNQQVPGLAQPSGTGVWQDSQTLPQPPETLPATQSQMPISMSADPVRCITWGPKTVYYVDNLPESESESESKKKQKKKTESNEKAKKDKKKKKPKAEDIKFQQVVLNGNEQMQTTEKIEVPGPEKGGGIMKTWVCVTRTIITSVEKQIDEKDVVVESSAGEESSSESEDTSSDDDAEEERRKKKLRKGKGKEERKEKKVVPGKGKEKKGVVGESEKVKEEGH
ncbi:MAG: hypothetical protein Q9168_005153 [Polycauliona sp. 1 TL-2023]